MRRVLENGLGEGAQSFECESHEPITRSGKFGGLNALLGGATPAHFECANQDCPLDIGCNCGWSGGDLLQLCCRAVRRAVRIPDGLYAAMPEVQIGNTGVSVEPWLVLSYVLSPKNGEKVCFI